VGFDVHPLQKDRRLTVAGEAPVADRRFFRTTKEERRIAMRAAKAMALSVAGVDMIRAIELKLGWKAAD
jgi:hypothetical protein